MKKVVVRSLTGIILSAFLIYASDYAVLRYRIATHRNAFGTATIQFYYAIQQKNGKTEYDFQPPKARDLRELPIRPLWLPSMLVPAPTCGKGHPYLIALFPLPPDRELRSFY